jgi:hypothetical protein
MRKWTPNKDQKNAFSNACREAESKGFKIHKTTRGLSLYGELNGKSIRISNHELPSCYAKDFEIEIVCHSQKDVFNKIGIKL